MTEPVNTKTSPKETFRAIRILCLALVIGAVIFALIIIGLNLVIGPAMPEDGRQYNTIFLAAVTGVSILFTIPALKIYKNGIVAIKNSRKPLTGKLNDYRNMLIQYMALCEGPVLFSIIVFFLTGDYRILAITAVILLAMLSRFPQKRKMMTELELDWKEQQDLE